VSGITKAERERREHVALVERVKAREAAALDAADRLSALLSDGRVEPDSLGYIVLDPEQAARLADLAERRDGTVSAALRKVGADLVGRGYDLGASIY
jgi:hypothetical protein